MNCPIVRTILVTYFCTFDGIKDGLQFLSVCNRANLPVLVAENKAAVRILRIPSIYLLLDNK